MFSFYWTILIKLCINSCDKSKDFVGAFRYLLFFLVNRNRIFRFSSNKFLFYLLPQVQRIFRRNINVSFMYWNNNYASSLSNNLHKIFWYCKFLRQRLKTLNMYPKIIIIIVIWTNICMHIHNFRGNKFLLFQLYLWVQKTFKKQERFYSSFEIIVGNKIIRALSIILATFLCFDCQFLSSHACYKQHKA